MATMFHEGRGSAAIGVSASRFRFPIQTFAQMITVEASARRDPEYVTEHQRSGTSPRGERFSRQPQDKKQAVGDRKKLRYLLLSLEG